MAYQTQLWLIEARSLPQNSGHRSITSSESSGGSQPHSTLRQTVKLSSKIALWKPTSERLSTSNRMTGPGFYWWRSLLAITPRMLAPVIHDSSWTVAINLGYRTKKMSTPAPSPSRRTNYQWNSESWWLFAEKISTMPRNLRNGLTIKESNLKTIFPARKFGWIANISRPCGTRSWRQSFLGRFECSILSGNKHTS